MRYGPATVNWKPFDILQFWKINIPLMSNLTTGQCLFAVCEKDLWLCQGLLRVCNSKSKQIYTVCKRLNYQNPFMLARTYMDYIGTHVPIDFPLTVLSALSAKVRAISGNSGDLFALGFCFEYWIPYTSVKVYSLLFVPSAKSLFISAAKFSSVFFLASIGYFFLLLAKIHH